MGVTDMIDNNDAMGRVVKLLRLIEGHLRTLVWIASFGSCAVVIYFLFR